MLGAEQAADLLQIDRGRRHRPGHRRSGAAARHRDDGHAGALHHPGSGRRARRALRAHRTDLIMTTTHAFATSHGSHHALSHARRSDHLRAGRGGCAAPQPCARWCARRGCRPTSSSTRCSSAPARARGAKSASMPGVFQLSVDEAVRGGGGGEGATASPACCCSACPTSKDAVGSGAYDPEAPVQAAIARDQAEVPGLLVVTDVCLCEYTVHGHCGILDRRRDRQRCRPSSSWCARRCRTRPPAPTSSRRRT